MDEAVRGSVAVLGNRGSGIRAADHAGGGTGNLFLCSGGDDGGRVYCLCLLQYHAGVASTFPGPNHLGDEQGRGFSRAYPLYHEFAKTRGSARGRDAGFERGYCV